MRKGGYLALEMHEQKDERLEVREGAGLILWRPPNEQSLTVEVLQPGSQFHFQPGMEHCIIGAEDLLVFERSVDPKGMDQDLIFIYEPDAVAFRCQVMPAEFYAFGEILWDCLPSGKHAGGAPFNVAAHLAQIGVSSALISCVGRDPLRRRDSGSGWSQTDECRIRHACSDRFADRYGARYARMNMATPLTNW